MALSIAELATRIVHIPAHAELYWYTEADIVTVRAEWSEPEDVFHAVEIMQYTAIQTGGPIT